VALDGLHGRIMGQNHAVVRLVSLLPTRAKTFGVYFPQVAFVELEFQPAKPMLELDLFRNRVVMD